MYANEFVDKNQVQIIFDYSKRKNIPNEKCWRSECPTITIHSTNSLNEFKQQDHQAFFKTNCDYNQTNNEDEVSSKIKTNQEKRDLLKIEKSTDCLKKLKTKLKRLYNKSWISCTEDETTSHEILTSIDELILFNNFKLGLCAKKKTRLSSSQEFNPRSLKIPNPLSPPNPPNLKFKNHKKKKKKIVIRNNRPVMEFGFYNLHETNRVLELQATKIKQIMQRNNIRKNFEQKSTKFQFRRTQLASIFDMLETRKQKRPKLHL